MSTRRKMSFGQDSMVWVWDSTWLPAVVVNHAPMNRNPKIYGNDPRNGSLASVSARKPPIQAFCGYSLHEIFACNHSALQRSSLTKHISRNKPGANVRDHIAKNAARHW
jgi:hypothetical protein